ncbi:MAG: hypothetical protein ACXVY5_03335 [Gaiellales bacterium]
MWALHAAVAAAIAVTHSRVPPERLYHSRRGGLSRAIVFLNFPTAVSAVAVLPFACRRRLAAISAPLCAVAALPGVVDERRLDARSRNAPAALGVALALAAGDCGPPGRAARPGDRFALAALLALSAPWVLSDLGIQTARSARPTPGRPDVANVHLGHHEGLDGAVLAASALLLSRRPARLGHRLYLALMLSYGVAVAAQDAWLEQVVKRGWTRRRLPDVVRPAPTRWWAGLLAVTLLTAKIMSGSPRSNQVDDKYSEV